MATEKVTLQKVGHFDKDKNGNTLTTRQGKPYTRCLIETNDGRKLSGFGSQATQSWKQGDTVEVEVSESNGYLNFSIPKKQDTGLDPVMREAILQGAKYAQANNDMLKAIVKHLDVNMFGNVGNTNVQYPHKPEGEPNFEPDINPEDIPF